MPPFRSREIGVALDMAGCPNRCRHCYLGSQPNRRASEETLRMVVEPFRNWVYPGEEHPFIERLTVHTWLREPDFSPNYRELWEVEKELSDPGAAMRYELLSIWRLARDEGYARWAREIGTEVCQITFFGLEEATDWFTRRPGSFRDNLVATERLLDVGIRPRWQLIMTDRILPDLEGLMCLVEEMGLEERTRQLGHEFVIFIHTPGPDGEAFNIEHLRPTVDALEAIPSYLAEKTKRHFGATTLEECIGEAEATLIPRLLSVNSPPDLVRDLRVFMVTPNLDVYPNFGELMPWWRLGNLKSDSVGEIMKRFEDDQVPGLYANFHVTVSELAVRYGRRDSQHLYDSDNLISRWLRMRGEEEYRKGRGVGSTITPPS